MAQVSLTNTNISSTYKGVLHAMGEQLPAIGQQYIHDGDGNRTSIKLGRENYGITVFGGITTTQSIVLSAGLNSYPRVQFGVGADNTDVMYITRVNNSLDSSELRINIGDNIHGIASSTDKFTIGGTTSPSSVFTPLLTLSGDGNMRVQLAGHPTPYVKPVSWGGGVTTFDFYSDGGSFGAGIGGTLAAYFNRDGNFFGKTFTTTSSLQHKTNITPLENALDMINKLEGVRFDWKDTGKSDIGLIAESVNEVLPEFVLKDDKTGESLGVDYGRITAVLIEAVKELTKLVLK